MTDAPKVSVILGGTGGIGSALARTLSQRGHRVFVASRTSDAVSTVAHEIGGVGRTVDATDADAVQGLMEEAAAAGRLVGVANCVGSLLIRPAHLTSPEDFRSTLETDLLSAFLAVRSGAPLLRDSGGGSILLFSSAAAHLGLPNHEAIAAAKGGVAALARSAAATYAIWKVRVNALAPGLVETPLTARVTSSQKARERSLSMHPLGRLGTPSDLARAAAWLLDPEESSWVTGQVLGVDGGLASLKGG
jgi:NAD(P)-dependent dehydrogenase (short-subunit alcohol dehydrogenase family)